MAKTKRGLDRLRQGEAAVYSVGEAARLLGWTGAAEWLHAKGLVYVVDGRERVIWGDALDAIRGDDRARPRFESPKPQGSQRRSWHMSPEELAEAADRLNRP
jgi:hypothetical protein